MSTRDSQGNICDWKIGLHLRSLGTPRVPEFHALRLAQAVYGQYGILVEFRSGQSLPAAVNSETQCLQLENVDVGTCTLNQAMTVQQSALFSYGSRRNLAAHEILCYWVDRVVSGARQLAGCAARPSDLGACVVSALGSPWTLAHEVGHVLGLRHESDNTMLMSTPTASIILSPPRISTTDLETIKASRHCVRI